jgi:short-subunit dehydrogenase
VYLFKDKYGPWAIILGAAEGLGKAYCIALAKRKLNLVMVDYRPSELKSLANKINEDYNILTQPLHLDLNNRQATTIILEAVKELDIGLFIYNAAFSQIKPFVNFTTDELDTFLTVNANTQIQLVHAFSKKLIARNKTGGILLMSSLAGLIGMQLVAPYAATKAFTWNLAEALNYELKPYNIDVMACVSGATATPTYLKSNPKYGFIKPLVMKSETVAEASLDKLGKRALFIPGFSNRLNYFVLTRLLPRKIATSIANKAMGEMYSHLNSGI